MLLEIEVPTEIRPRSVGIGETVFERQPPRAVQASRFFKHPGVRCERRDRAADEAGSLGVNEAVALCLWMILGCFPPVRLGYAERIEYGFRAHEARRDGDCRDPMLVQLLGHR